MGTPVGSFLKEVKFLHMDSPNEAVPTGWAICNGATLSSGQQDINPGGTYTLPNMIDRFLLGANPAGTAGAAGNSTGTAPGPNAIGGAHQFTMAMNQMPRHFHQFKYQVLRIPNGYDPQDPPYQFFPRDFNAWTDSVQNQGNFISYEGGNYEHTNPDSAGGGVAPVDIRPKFASVVPIMRVKL